MRSRTEPVTGSTEPVRPLRRDAAENRRRVLEAATEVFATHGLDASVEEIAHAAGVGMGTLYRRFPTKEALIEHLVWQLTEQLLTVARLAVGAEDGGGLARFLHDAGQLLEAHWSCISRLWGGGHTEAQLAEFDALLATLLHEAQAAGVVRADASTTDVTVIFWALRGIIESAGGVAPNAWRRHVDLVLAGLRPDAVGSPYPPMSAEQRRAARAFLQRVPPPPN